MVVLKVKKRSKYTLPRLRKIADKLWKELVIRDYTYCEVCGVEPVQTGHHFFPKGLFGHLRYDLQNGIAIGTKCHFNHHHRGDPRIHQIIIERKGPKWYFKLLNKSRKNPHSYQTREYYEKVIKRLKDNVARVGIAPTS